MLPHGPRPTAIPRATRAAPSSPTATNPRNLALRETGLAGSPAALGRVAARSTKLPVTTPAKAGCGEATKRGRALRPLASRTAWPTWAANASATAITPMMKKSWDALAMSCLRDVRAHGALLLRVSGGSGGRGAARRGADGMTRRSRRGVDHPEPRPWLDQEVPGPSERDQAHE